jgi:hypothetical protein
MMRLYSATGMNSAGATSRSGVFDTVPGKKDDHGHGETLSRASGRRLSRRHPRPLNERPEGHFENESDGKHAAETLLVQPLSGHALIFLLFVGDPAR